VDGVSLAEKRRATDLLLNSGAEIAEINIVRKHLSRVKGGGLGRHFAPAPVVSVIISDVAGNDISVIASGLTAADPSTFTDALFVIDKFNLRENLPLSVIGYLERGQRGEAPEMPKSLPNCRNFIAGDNRMALEAMKQRAEELGHHPIVVTPEQKGDTTAVARSRAAEIIAGKFAGHDVIILGGETTPRVLPWSGRGGRNQHYAAASLLAMAEYPGDWLVTSVGTDGSDYLNEIAGAVVDRETLSAAHRGMIDIETYIQRFDSNTLLNQIGGSLIVTGETGTNVGDVILYMLA